VPSRLSGHTASVVGTTVPAHTGVALMDSLDFQLNTFGANNTHSKLPYQTSTQILQEPKPAVSANTYAHIPRYVCY
jgi:hypothetical protein